MDGETVVLKDVNEVAVGEAVFDEAEVVVGRGI